MNFKYFFQGTTLCFSIIYSLSGMSGMPTDTASTTVTTEVTTQDLTNKIKEYKNKTSLTEQINYLQQILSENQGKTISNEAKNEFRIAIINIWNQSWGLRNKSSFSKLHPFYLSLINFFTSIVSYYNNFIVNTQFKTWINNKTQVTKLWIVQKKKEARTTGARGRSAGR